MSGPSPRDFVRKDPLMRVEDLVLYYKGARGIVKAVDGVDFSFSRGRCLALVGESGCGKSSTAYSLMRLLPRNLASFSGSVRIDGVETMTMSDDEFRKKIRWRTISIVPQGAMNSLNPTMRVGVQVAEPLLREQQTDRTKALQIAEDALRQVGVPIGLTNTYAHELSGGMKQRVVISMALVTEPKIVILDEPTSALDVMTQANILNLLKKLKRERTLSYIFITHDLALASELADHVAVMYAGKIVELGPAEAIHDSSKHPYTQKLLAAVPSLKRDKKLDFIPGTAPDLVDPPPGCRFHPRCPSAMPQCSKEVPEMRQVGDEHYVSCWLFGSAGS